MVTTGNSAFWLKQRLDNTTATAMAALQQALAAVNNERAAKTQRTGKGKSKGTPNAAPATQPSQPAAASATPDNTLVQNLARLTLQQQPMLRTAFDANSITFLIQPEEMKTQLNDLVTTWFTDLQANKDTAGYQPFNCPKPVLILQFMVQHMQKAKPTNADATSQPWAILDKWLAMEPAELSPQLTDFRAKYRTPKENRKWVWQMTIASTAAETFRAEVRTMLTHNSSWSTSGIEMLPTRTAVPTPEKELWKQLRTRQ